MFSRSLGWSRRLDSILAFLGFGTTRPNEHQFAEAVARWQSEQPGLVVDGILGPNTWGRLGGAVGPSPPIDVARAVAGNRQYGRSLGWRAYASAIGRLIGFSTTFPSEAQFARAVARWQRAQGGLLVDGILGPRTLARMETWLRQPEMGAATGVQSEAFFTHIPPIPPSAGPSRIPGAELGHEVMTERAARRAGIPAGSAIDVALTAGVTRVDIGRTTTLPGGIVIPPELPLALVHALVVTEQRRHALRGGPDLCQPIPVALSEIRNHLIALHSNALAASTLPRAFEFVGEALHLIQDSFSPAHVEREGTPPHPIRYIRFFARIVSPVTWPPRSPLLIGRAPHEHQFPTDSRDSIFLPGGALTAEAVRASDVSVVFLLMVRRHLTAPRPPAVTASRELRAFMDVHLALSAAPVDPRTFHPGCP